MAPYGHPLHRANEGVKPSIAWRLLIAFGSLKVAVHCLVNATVAYGYSTDELYFLDSTSRLAWGYLDHPPLTILALAGWTARLAAIAPAVGPSSGRDRPLRVNLGPAVSRGVRFERGRGRERRRAEQKRARSRRA